MGNINDAVGAIGGAILAIELIVLLLILVAINAGLFFALRWVLGRQEWLHEKVTWAVGLLTKNVDRGANVAARPVILSTSLWRGLKAGLFRATHWPAQPAATRPPAPSRPAAQPASRATAEPGAATDPSRAA